jgi:hypothetical protein
MKGLERVVVIAALAYMAVYVPYFLVQMQRLAGGAELSFFPFFALHLLGMALNLGALVLTIRDLNLRDFPHANDKLTWCLLILLTGGLGWLVYVFKYALKDRRADG